ncbi:MAG: outer membrane beta-barrel domain-containing protein [Bdellovibrionaceae bacterium]|nr:outer membrane beta-barrel domain-containing protein [Pseudobdellovibrionaceae bacterium]
MKTWKFLVILILINTPKLALAQVRESDKLDIQKLEEKYWSAKDDDFKVVQNRTYAKEDRFFVNLAWGVPINDPYSSGALTTITGGYFFNERYGLEGYYSSGGYTNNQATEQFIQDHGTFPNHNKFLSAFGLGATWMPFYAKMAFLEQKIIYFDMGASLNLGLTNFLQKVSDGDRTASGIHYGITLTQSYFFSTRFAIRLDYRNIWTPEERLRYKLNPGEQESARSLGVKPINDTTLQIGLTYWH